MPQSPQLPFSCRGLAGMFCFKINHPLFFLPVSRLKHCNMREEILELVFIFIQCPRPGAGGDIPKPGLGNIITENFSELSHSAAVPKEVNCSESNRTDHQVFKVVSICPAKS